MTAASYGRKAGISPRRLLQWELRLHCPGTASSPEAANAVYRYIYYDGITWREIYRSDKVESVEWKPENTGTYLVAFQVQCGGQETNAFQSLNVTDNYFDFSGIRTAARSAGGIDIYPQYEASQEMRSSFTYMIYDLAAQAWYMLQENGGASVPGIRQLRGLLDSCDRTGRGQAMKSLKPSDIRWREARVSESVWIKCDRRPGTQL